MTNYANLTREQAQVLICSTAPSYKFADMMELLKDYDKAVYQDAFVPEYYSLIVNCVDGEIEFLYQVDEWTGWVWDNLEVLANIKKGKRLY
jgi:hypothetical protein